MSDFLTRQSTYDAEIAAYNAWEFDQGDPSYPLYGSIAPIFPTLEEPETTQIKIQPSDPLMQSYNVRINWIHIDETNFTGLGKVGAVQGDVWFEKDTDINWTTYDRIYSSDDDFTLIETPNTITVMNAYHQVTPTTYKRLKIYGLIHENFVYGGKSVTITSSDALDDIDVSGFIIPLHNPTFKDLSLKYSTQMATDNVYMVINSYQIVTQRWYQHWLVQAAIVIAAVALAVYTGGGSLAAAQGLLGANAAVGATLGFTGLTAAIIGAALNVIAAIILSKVIIEISVKFLGPKWGAIIGSIISFALTVGISSGFSTAAAMDMILQPMTLLSISSALANGYAGFTQELIEELERRGIEDKKDYENESEKINSKLQELIGTGPEYFNPMELTNTQNRNQITGSYIPESLDDFIFRTTMTGNDIVEISLSLVSDYSELSLILPKT